jgi:hypothetical protein
VSILLAGCDGAPGSATKKSGSSAKTDSPTSSPTAAPVGSIPAKAVAAWPVFTPLDARNATALSAGATLGWGPYNERPEELWTPADVGHTQELFIEAGVNHASFAVDFGTLTETIGLQAHVPSGTARAEIRDGSATGRVLGSCSLPITGFNADGSRKYVWTKCALNTALAVGKKTIYVVLTSSVAINFNFAAYYAFGSTQQIDDLLKTQWGDETSAVGSKPLAGQPVRTSSALPPADKVRASSFGLWAPGKAWECPAWLHNTYWVKGSDEKIYHTWHPPVEFNHETGQYCAFGHEHGDDPSLSNAFEAGGWPAFGILNETHAGHEHHNERREDHNGHKTRVKNGAVGTVTGKNTPFTCDYVTKVHMGTHSPDALVNTIHEAIRWGRCQGTDAFLIHKFSTYGTPGSFKEAEAQGCNQPVTPGLAASPTAQPNVFGHRAIPTKDCWLRGTPLEQAQYANSRTSEFWYTLFALGGTGFDSGTAYYVVADPSRYYDSASSTKIARTVDLCYEAAHPLAVTTRCQLTVALSAARVLHDDPRSWFRGSHQSGTHISGFGFPNTPSGIVYTDAYGLNAGTTPDPKANPPRVYKQTVPRTGFSFSIAGHASLFQAADYSASGKNGVRAPN